MLLIPTLLLGALTCQVPAANSYEVDADSSFPVDTEFNRNPEKTRYGKLVLELKKLLSDPSIAGNVAGSPAGTKWTLCLAPDTVFDRDAFKKVFKERGASVRKLEISRIRGFVTQDDKGAWWFEADPSKKKFRLERAKAPKKKDGKDAPDAWAQLEKLAGQEKKESFTIAGEVDLKSKDDVIALDSIEPSEEKPDKGNDDKKK